MVESNTIEAQNIRNEVPKLSNTAKQFVDIHIKLHGIFEKLEAGTKKSIDELVQNECINTIRMNNMLIQNPQQSEGGVMTLKPRTNNFIVVRGEAVYHFKCNEIFAKVEETIEKDVEGNAVCYNSLKVIVGEEEMFLKPSTRLLATNAERVPCADQLPMRFESRDWNSWIVVDSNGIRNEKRTSFPNRPRP